MKLVIDRSKWLRGEGYEKSGLLRASDYKQCCIGFLCEALGVPRDILEKQKASQNLGEKFPFLPKWLTSLGSNDLFRAYDANDEIGLSNGEREARITEIFAKHDIEVEFI